MFKVIVENSEIKAAFKRLSDRSSDLTPAMNDIGSYMLKRIDDGFRNERSFYNVPWARLSDRTIKQKQKKKQIGKILQSTGLLRGTFSYTAGRSSVEIGTNRVGAQRQPIGIFHQLGTRRMPARPILPTESRGLPPQDTEEILNIIGDYLTNSW